MIYSRTKSRVNIGLEVYSISRQDSEIGIIGCAQKIKGRQVAMRETCDVYCK